MPEEWPWSSYPATTGDAPRPAWLDTGWLLAQLGAHAATAVPAYVNHVRAGIGLPPVWSGLKNPLYLGDEDFAQQLQLKAQSRATQTEIPRAQRRAGAPPLDPFLAMADRHSAMAQAYRTGCYSLKEIAETFGVHCATVSRVVKAENLL